MVYVFYLLKTNLPRFCQIIVHQTLDTP